MIYTSTTSSRAIVLAFPSRLFQSFLVRLTPLHPPIRVQAGLLHPSQHRQHQHLGGSPSCPAVQHYWLLHADAIGFPHVYESAIESVFPNLADALAVSASVIECAMDVPLVGVVGVAGAATLVLIPGAHIH